MIFKFWRFKVDRKTPEIIKNRLNLSEAPPRALRNLGSLGLNPNLAHSRTFEFCLRTEHLSYANDTVPP